MKKRLIAIALLFALLFSTLLTLTSCDEKYEPVESTAEEKKTVMKISYDGEKYDVPYELYRAFFLQMKSAVDGGNSEVWTGAEKDKYVAMADELVYARIAEIYSVFYLCEKADINVYSSEFDDKVESIIEVAVEGGDLDGVSYVGFGGDYQKYLDSLKEMNLNYSVQDLLLRYQIAYEKLASYYMGDFSDDSLSEDAQIGEIKYTKEDVKRFYLDKENSRRVVIMQLSEPYFNKETAEEKRSKIAGKTDEKAVINYIGSIVGTPNIEVIGKYTYDKLYYSEMTDAAFSLGVGDTSRVITMKTEDFDGYVILYRLEANEEFFNSNYDAIRLSYLYNEFGKKLQSISSAIIDAITPTDALSELDRSLVSMN